MAGPDEAESQPRRRRRRWKASKFDLVLLFGMALMTYGATGLPGPVVSGALIGAGPIIMGMGLGLRWDRGQ